MNKNYASKGYSMKERRLIAFATGAPGGSFEEQQDSRNAIDAAADLLEARVKIAMDVDKQRELAQGAETSQEFNERETQAVSYDVEKVELEVDRIERELYGVGYVINMEMPDGADMEIAMSSQEELVRFLREYRDSSTPETGTAIT